ncbi:MAG: adenosylcobinamide-GDP ribazoletransferase [Clostridiales bacterium]|nr:adenosylcobinamide-GDP ribazoletransferase [Clostridiales bacterium]
MYSKIPVPQTEWTEDGMRYAMCFFPGVGVVLGFAAVCFHLLSVLLGFGVVADACLGTVLPLLVTGGIHMDGFLDTVDALCSWQDRERKLAIMKDPHTGAFAVVGCSVYLLCYAAAYSELGAGAFPAIAGIHVGTRALSGWAVAAFPKAKKEGLVSTFAGQADIRTVKISMVLWGLAATGYMVVTAGPLTAAAICLTGLLCLAGYHRMAVREFGGVTGDLAGFFLQICELIMIVVLAFLAS